jgi:hypothetical protein
MSGDGEVNVTFDRRGLYRQRARAAPADRRIKQPACAAIEIALLPDNVRISCSSTASPKRERHRRQAQAQLARWH